jgi:hypothetical protein
MVCGGAATLSTPESPRLSSSMRSAAIAEQLLASGSEEKAGADPVKKLEPAFILEIADLSRQCGLADAQTQRCLGHGAEVGHRDEGPQALQVHPAYLQNA